MSAILEAPAKTPVAQAATSVFQADMFGYISIEDQAALEAARLKEAEEAQKKIERASKQAAKAAAKAEAEAKSPKTPEELEAIRIAKAAKKRDAFTFDLFSGDNIAAMKVIALTEDAHLDTAEALERNPHILGVGAQSPQALLVARETLDDARFQRNAGLPLDEVRESLHVAGVDADAVLQQLAQVEQEVGADYPEQPIPELAPVIDEDLEDDFTEELDGEMSLGDEDDEDAPKAKRKKKEEEALAGTALTALMRRIRGPRYEPLTEDQENALYVRIKAGDAAARNELVEHNMRFLVSRAKTFTYTGRPMDFLISAGTTGLIIAAEKFDPARGRFTSCAAQWIRQSIQRSLLGDSLLKTPAHLPVKANKLRREADAETDPTLKAELTVKAEAAERELKARRSQHVSLDGGQDDDSDGGGLHNMFASEAEGPDEMMEKRRLLAQLLKAANELTDSKGNANDRGREIFLRRMGLHEDHVGEPQTLAEVAEVLSPAGADGKTGISRERVRQLYVTAATQVADAVIAWAKGEDNLPAGFRKSLLNPGR